MRFIKGTFLQANPKPKLPCEKIIDILSLVLVSYNNETHLHVKVGTVCPQVARCTRTERITDCDSSSGPFNFEIA